MSVSIDDEAAGGGEDSRSVLASWLDDYSEGRCDIEDVQESFLSVCRGDPDAPWDALALLDQYTRRGRIEAELAQSLKADIEKLVFGVASPRDKPRDAVSERAGATLPNASTISHEAAPMPPDSTSDLTAGSSQRTQRNTLHESGGEDISARWRKLLAERDADATRPATATPADRTVLRRDVAPGAATEPGLKTEPSLRTDPGVRSGPASTRRAASASAPSRAAVNQILRDRYELLSVLGRGASGTVYRAIDRRRTHLSEAARCVAVKVFNTNYADEQGPLADLEREFHQAQSLAHPNIVSVFDLDRDGDTYFIVMELLEGSLLADVLRELAGRPMRRDHALAIISGVGAALAHAHRREMVHADLKPRNIMITSSGEVRVLDFGFARDRALDLHSASTLHEAPIPSPAYASVERVNGSEPDASDDVYSLACIAYELLSGQHPFGGRSALLARAHGRRPPRISGLNNKQMQALQRALLWTRGERRINVVELLNALGCTETASTGATPEEILASDESRPRWARLATVAACVVAAIAAVLYFGPRPALRDAASLVTATPVKPPPADREAGKNESAPPPAASAGPTAAPVKDVPEPAEQAPAPKAASVREKETPRQVASASSDRTKPAATAAAGPAMVEFDKDTYVATESDGSVRLLVKRSGSTRSSATFTWSLRGNSAGAGTDFAAIGPGSEQISAGANEASLTIPLVQDALVENTELFLVELQATQDGVKLGERAHAAVIIVDDD
jgi:Protein kinase domain/Calx-beta domain